MTFKRHGRMAHESYPGFFDGSKVGGTVNKYPERTSTGGDEVGVEALCYAPGSIYTDSTCLEA